MPRVNNQPVPGCDRSVHRAGLQGSGPARQHPRWAGRWVPPHIIKRVLLQSRVRHLPGQRALLGGASQAHQAGEDEAGQSAHGFWCLSCWDRVELNDKSKVVACEWSLSRRVGTGSQGGARVNRDDDGRSGGPCLFRLAQEKRRQSRIQIDPTPRSWLARGSMSPRSGSIALNFALNRSKHSPIGSESGP